MSQITTRNTGAVVQSYSETRHRATGKLPMDVSVRYLAQHLKTYLKWAWQEGYVTSDKFRDIKLSKADDAYVELYSDEAVSTYFACIDDYWDAKLHPEILRFRHAAADRNRFRVRGKLIFAISVSTGMRKSEILRLCWRNWVPERRVLVVEKSKGRTAREVCVTAALEKIINEWHAACKTIKKSKVAAAKAPLTPAQDDNPNDEEGWSVCGPDDYIICSDAGGELDGGACLRQLQRYAAWGRLRGMQIPPITIHKGRHKALNDLLQISPEHARQMAGHKSIVTTQKRYGHTTTDDARASHDKSDVLGRIASKKSGVGQTAPAPLKGRRPKIF